MIALNKAKWTFYIQGDNDDDGPVYWWEAQAIEGPTGTSQEIDSDICSKRTFKTSDLALVNLKEFIKVNKIEKYEIFYSQTILT